MFFLYFLYKKNKKLFKYFLISIISILLLLIIFFYHIFSNLEINFKKLKLKNENFILELRIKNKSFFDVNLDKIKLEIRKYELGKPEENGKRIEKMKILKNETKILKVFFKILGVFENEKFEGDLMVVMSKWKIKVPYEHKIR